MDQMHLPQVGLGRINGHAGTVFHRDAGMGITDNPRFSTISMASTAILKNLCVCWRHSDMTDGMRTVSESFERLRLLG